MYIPVFQKNLTARQPWYHGQHQNIWKVDCHPPKCGLIAFDQSPISQWPSSSRFIIYSYNYLQHVMTHYIHIYIYIYASGPATPPPPPWDGSHILAPYDIFPLPPPVVWWGVVWYVGYVWCVWSVWYGMFGKYGMFGMYGMYGMNGWYCMDGRYGM